MIGLIMTYRTCHQATGRAGPGGVFGAVKATCALIAVFGALAALLAAPQSAQAMVSCPFTPASLGSSDVHWEFDIDLGICRNRALGSTGFATNGIDIETDNGFLTHGDFITPGQGVGGAGNAGDYGPHLVTSVDISPSAGGNIASSDDVGFGVHRINFSAADAGAQTYVMTIVKAGVTYKITVVGTFRQSPATQEIQSITITGGVFGSEQGNGDLEGQQSAFTDLVIRAQSTAITDGAFGALDEAFSDGEGPLVTAAGFSVSARGTRNWLMARRAEALRSRLADLPRDGNGSPVHAVPVSADGSDPDWNVWLKGDWTFYDGDGSSFDGHTGNLLAGADLRVGETVVIGVLAGYGLADFDTDMAGTTGGFDADGYTVGPYAGVKLGESARLDVLAAYTYSDYDNRSGGTRGTFSADRITLAARLKGRWDVDGYFVEPALGVFYAHEDQDAYTDTAGVRHSGRTVKAGRVSLGPRVGYVLRAENGDTITPWISVKGEYDFSNRANAPSSGLPDFGDILSARISLGLDAHTAKGLSITVKGDVGGLGSGDYTSYGGSARVGMPF